MESSCFGSYGIGGMPGLFICMSVIGQSSLEPLLAESRTLRGGETRKFEGGRNMKDFYSFVLYVRSSLMYRLVAGGIVTTVKS